MKNLIRGAALFIGGMIGLSGCLVSSAAGNFTVSLPIWTVCGLMTIIGIIFLFSGKTKELLLPIEEQKDKDKEK